MADSIFQRATNAARAAVGLFTNDDTKRAWNLLSGVLPGGLGMPPARYTREYLKSYSQMPWLRAVSNKIATSVASAEWKLYYKAAAPDKTGRRKALYARDIASSQDPTLRRKRLKELANRDELKQVETHPLLDVLHNANSFQTGLQLRKITQLHVDLAGEAFWLKERDGSLGDDQTPGGPVVAVWPIPPDWILNTPTPTNPFYRVQYRAWRGLIPDTEFLWFQESDPSNPYGRGTGTAQALGDELETDEYTAKHTKAFFYNRAKPDLIVFPKQGQIRGPDIARLEQDWMQSNQGFWRAFKPYFMSREVGVHEMDQNFRSMQLVQLREFERDIILQTFGIPPEVLGVLSHSNRATVSAADYFMQRHVVQPRLEFLRAIMQEKFVPEFDDRLLLDYETTVEEDKEEQMQLAKTFTWALSINEQRVMSGQEPLAGKEGDCYIIPSTMSVVASLDTAVKQAEAQHEMAITPPPPPPGFHPESGAPLAPVGPDGKPIKPAPPKVPPAAAKKPPKGLKYSDAEARDDHGRWTDGGSSSGGPTGYHHTSGDGFLMGPAEACDALAQGQHVDIDKGDVLATLGKAASRTDDPDLTDLHVEGMLIFGGNGLGIARKDMPQIDDAHREDFIATLRKDGVTVMDQHSSPLALYPTQSEVSARKVGQMLAKYESGDKKKPFDPVFVSKDNYVLDGHHRWGVMTALAVDAPHLTMPVTRIMVGHAKALDLMARYAHAHGIANKPTGKAPRVQRWLRC